MCYFCNMKTIRIPKTESLTWVEIKKTQTTKYSVVLKKQELYGIIIPNNSTIGIDTSTCEFNSNNTKINIPPYNMNRLLRFVFLENLRKG